MGRALLAVLLGGALLPGVAPGQSARPPELNVQYYRAETAWRSLTSSSGAASVL